MIRFDTKRALMLVLLAGLAVPGIALARGGNFCGKHPGPMGMTGNLIEKNADRLGLDEQRLEVIRGFAEDARSHAETIHQELEGAHAVLRDLIEQDTPDPAAVMAQVDRVGALQLERQKHHVATLLQIRQQLTPDQRNELDAIREEKMAGHGKREGRGGRSGRRHSEASSDLY